MNIVAQTVSLPAQTDSLSYIFIGVWIMKSNFRYLTATLVVALSLWHVHVAFGHDGPHDEPVPFGGDSMFPWVMIFLTFLGVGLMAAWMFRSSR
jgi:hypothetical protein